MSKAVAHLIVVCMTAGGVSAATGVAQQQPAGPALWLDAERHPNRDAKAALDLLRNAGDDGLDPADYGVGTLDGLAKLLRGDQPAVALATRFEQALDESFLLYLRDLRVGRIDPASIGLRQRVTFDSHDLASALRNALADHRLVEAVQEFRPPLEQYRSLCRALTRYRALEADRAFELVPASSTTVRPGHAYKYSSVLARELEAFGDLAPTALQPEAYDGALVEAVKRFQTRHGLDADGVLGPRTIAALRVPIGTRVRQIELGLERLRWLPHLSQGRLIMLNIPMFRLWAWNDARSAGPPAIAMDVIVGRAVASETPVLSARMTEVAVRPYWTVPLSIVRTEIIPAVARDPDYLTKHEMDLVAGSGDELRVVPANAASMADLRDGRLAVRQRPGARNALGLIAFQFPNEQRIFMHDTPSTDLFSRARRDFSHGCVRVQDPVALAEWVIDNQGRWRQSDLTAAITGDQSLSIRIERPIQVLLFYSTAAVTPEDGTVRFAEDIYRQDLRLDQALQAGRAARRSGRHSSQAIDIEGEPRR